LDALAIGHAAARVILQLYYVLRSSHCVQWKTLVELTIPNIATEVYASSVHVAPRCGHFGINLRILMWRTQSAPLVSCLPTPVTSLRGL